MTEPLDVLEARLAALHDGAGPARVEALLALVEALNIRDQPRRLALTREARALAEELGELRLRALAVGYEGHALYFLSDYGAARPLLVEAVEALTDQGDPMAGRFRGVLAGLHASVGDYETALTIALHDLEAARAAGDQMSEGWLLQGLSTTFLENGQAEPALDLGRQALPLFEEIGLAVGQARARSSIGSALVTLGRLDEAEGEHERSLALFRAAGDRLGEARALHDLGRLLRARGDLAPALDHHRQALAIRREVGNRQAESTSLIEIGQTLTALGRPEEGLPLLQEALALADALGVRPRVFQARRALAEALEAAGDPAAALRQYHAYEAAAEEVRGQQVRARLDSVEAAHEAELARREAEISRLRFVDLREKNEQLEKLLAELRATQGRLVQSEKLASLGRMVAGVAHEIKNPLNFITNFAALAQELVGEVREAIAADPARPAAAVAAEAADALDDLETNTARIAQHGRRADGIVRSMLAHARTSTGERAPTDVHALLDGAVGLALRHADDGGPGVLIERAYDLALPPVPVVAQEVERVFVNLVDNALYAVRRRAEAEGPGYRPRVRLVTEREDARATVRVEDNGEGIAAAACARVFEPFFTTKPSGEGTGLGLSLAYDIVTQGHGGALSVRSVEGEGTTFSVRLPLDATSSG